MRFLVFRVILRCPSLKVIEEAQVRPLYTLSHEPGVGFAANAAARLHGQ